MAIQVLRLRHKVTNWQHLADSARLGSLSEAPAYQWHPADIQDASRDQIAS